MINKKSNDNHALSGWDHRVWRAKFRVPASEESASVIALLQVESLD